jgi:hypothetical protein
MDAVFQSKNRADFFKRIVDKTREISLNKQEEIFLKQQSFSVQFGLNWYKKDLLENAQHYPNIHKVLGIQSTSARLVEPVITLAQFKLMDMMNDALKPEQRISSIEGFQQAPPEVIEAALRKVEKNYWP